MAVYVGNPTYASDFSAALPTLIRKPADLGRTSVTAQSLDPDLQATLNAGLYYIVISNIIYNGDSTADWKGGIQAPSGGSFTGTIRAQAAGATATSGSIVTDVQTGTGFVAGCIGTGTSLTALIIGVLYTGTGGQFGLTWAQNSSVATATTVKANSFIALLQTA
jgi:hypothetical protein